MKYLEGRCPLAHSLFLIASWDVRSRAIEILSMTTTYIHISISDTVSHDRFKWHYRRRALLSAGVYHLTGRT